MDDLSSTFGYLSTNAAEFRPRSGGGGGTTSISGSGFLSNQISASAAAASAPITSSAVGLPPHSDLNAWSVKEFVPGQGWTATTLSKAEATTAANQQQYEDSTTIPAGHIPPPLPSFRALHSLGLPDDLWKYHRDLALESIRQMDPSDLRHKAVPIPYCNAYCLDSDQQRGRSSFGYPSQTFQVVSREDGHLYCLRRFDNVRSVSPKIAATITDRWTRRAIPVLEHPGIVPLYQCFVAQRAVFFVHHYIAGASTLRERLNDGPMSENILWSCITQLVSAIRVIHMENLAVRTIRVQHILANPDATGSRLRVRLNCLGIIDALEFEARKLVSDLQIIDMRDLGRLILCLASGTEITSHTDNMTLSQCEAFLTQHYSRDLQNLAMTLLRGTPNPPTIMDVGRAIAQRTYFEEHDTLYRVLDRTERALATEYEAGRVLRLLLKLGFINERPEFGPNRRWAQSGDCYVLTLFRDFVFHQADGAGNPILDLGHVLTALNRLDAASEERIVLSSREGKSLMVVSYSDVARCLENAFSELVAGSVPASAMY